MAATQTLSDSSLPAIPAGSGLLVSLSGLSPDALQGTLANLALAFPNRPVLAASPDPPPATLPESSQLLFTTYTPAAPAPGGWVLSAADFLNAWKLMEDHPAAARLLLGSEAQSLAPEALRALVDAVVSGGADLTTPRYSLGPSDPLVNSAILYPVTRALFGTRTRYPLAIDLAFSTRMAERLAVCAQKHTAANQSAALVWPVAEAAAAGFAIAEVPTGTRALPPPDFADLNTLLAQVAGSLFSDIHAKAAIWQRARLAYPARGSSAGPAAAQSDAAASEAAKSPNVQPMLDSFHLAYTNLQEIWSLVLPPNSLLGLKKLSLMPAAAFRMPDALWARIVYDFILAYGLRTINRGHLLGALTPLYLAWVASHLLLASAAGPETIAPEKHVEALATAFETDKPYLVARWRWPDRFNP